MEFTTELLSPLHRVDRFDCGEAALNDYLGKFALQNQNAGAARTYVVSIAARVIGYYSLSAGSIEPATASQRLMKGLSARQPLPVVLLGRLAVDQPQQGRGLGNLLLRDAIGRFVQAARNHRGARSVGACKERPSGGILRAIRFRTIASESSPRRFAIQGRASNHSGRAGIAE